MKILHRLRQAAGIIRGVRVGPLLILLLAGAALAPVIGEPLSLSALAVWLVAYGIIGVLAAREDNWGTVGRGFLASRLGRIVSSACERVMPLLVGTGKAAAALCSALTILIGEVAYTFYQRWLQPGEV